MGRFASRANSVGSVISSCDCDVGSVPAAFGGSFLGAMSAKKRLYSARAWADARSLAFCNAVTNSSLLILDRPATPNRLASS